MSPGQYSPGLTSFPKPSGRPSAPLPSPRMRGSRDRLAELLHRTAERIRPNPLGAAEEPTVADQDRRLGEGLRIGAERERSEKDQNLKIARGPAEIASG